jgi:hypothetical protein
MADIGRCESYNTVQISLTRGVSGENLDQSDGDDWRYPAARPRSSSYRIDERLCSNQPNASSQLTPGTVSGTSSYPGSASPSLLNPDAHASRSISQPRTRAVSPAISNYFGLSRKRESADSPSRYSRRLSDHESNTNEESSFWSRASLRYRYDLFSDDTGLTNDETDADGDNDDESPESADDADEDDVDSIDIFGHL